MIMFDVAARAQFGRYLDPIFSRKRVGYV